MPRKKKASKFQIIPLGGVGEIGKNMIAVQMDGDILVIDAGLMFPDEEMLGVDIVIPDFTYLVENADKVKGVVVTHGHEDHIGALPYLLRSVNAPIWGSRLALGFLRAKLEEHKLLDSAVLNEVAPGDRLKIGPFDVEFIRVSHSIPDCCGLAIRTPVGTVLQTSDFKFDQTPVDGKLMDVSRFAQIGDEGVLLMLTDCTNVEKPGYTPSERVVGRVFDEVFAGATGRIIVATFASNIHRIQQVVDAADKYQRQLAVIGRSMEQNTEIAAELGYLHIPDWMKIGLDKLGYFEPNQIVIVTTGSQGEPLSALSRMAMDEHKQVKITEGDTVIISAKPIPGNEDLVMRTINRLFRRGAKVIYDAITPVHVSGHGNQEDLKLMLNLIRPRYIVPTHGEDRHYAKYVEMAADLGYEPERVFRMQVGDVLEVESEEAKLADPLPVSGSVMVDGIGVGDVTEVVLRDRRHLGLDGILVVVLTLDRSTGAILAGPDIISRGFVIPEFAEELLEEAKSVVIDEVQSMETEEATETSAVKINVRKPLSKFLYERTRRRPMILPVIMEV